MHVNCPKCDADVSDSYERADFSVGIMSGGWYCDACDLGIGENEVLSDEDCAIPPAPQRDPSQPLGTPISELSGQPGPKDDIGHPDHTRYENFKRIARSCGYD